MFFSNESWKNASHSNPYRTTIGCLLIFDGCHSARVVQISVGVVQILVGLAAEVAQISVGVDHILIGLASGVVQILAGVIQVSIILGTLCMSSLT